MNKQTVEAHFRKGKQWKGDQALYRTKHARMARLIPLGPCVNCGRQGHDRHCQSEDYTDIIILCRRCHMLIDGRIARSAGAQATARLITYNHRKQSISAWARERHLSDTTLRNRLFILHWSVKEALFTPVRGHLKPNAHLITWKRRTQTLIQWATELRIHHNTLAKRLKKWGLPRAFTEPIKEQYATTRGRRYATGNAHHS